MTNVWTDPMPQVVKVHIQQTGWPESKNPHPEEYMVIHSTVENGPILDFGYSEVDYKEIERVVVAFKKAFKEIYDEDVLISFELEDGSILTPNMKLKKGKLDDYLEKS